MVFYRELAGMPGIQRRDVMKLETMAVKNFKTLCDIRLENIPRFCVFIGANGGIIEQMKQRVPGIGDIQPESTADGRLLLKCIRLWCSLLLFNQLSFLMMCLARYSFISLCLGTGCDSLVSRL